MTNDAMTNAQRMTNDQWPNEPAGPLQWAMGNGQWAISRSRPGFGGVQRCRCRPRFARGFSLMEIMIVIVIIGLLAGVVTLNVRSYLSKAKQETARHEIATMMHAVETFNATYNRYPTNEEGLGILCKATDKFPEGLLNSKTVPIDPWGHPYQYNCPGSDGSPYEIISYGADGKEGGDGYNADISSKNLKQ